MYSFAISLLVGGASALHIPFDVLLYRVVAFIVIPLVAGVSSRFALLKLKGSGWFEKKFLPKWGHLTIAAPGALIGASNFFELAVATAIALFGADSGAALATVVGVLVEVPVMLRVCEVCNRSRAWYSESN